MAEYVVRIRPSLSMRAPAAIGVFDPFVPTKSRRTMEGNSVRVLVLLVIKVEVLAANAVLTGMLKNKIPSPVMRLDQIKEVRRRIDAEQ